MPDRDTARMLIAKEPYLRKGSGEGRSLHPKTGRSEHIWSEGSSTQNESGRDEREAPSPEMAVVWQWICFALGIVSMACGVWGICVQRGQNALPGWSAWLGSFYVPVLRLVAVLCLGIGVVMVRRGWARP